jgi:hypothetical protein
LKKLESYGPVKNAYTNLTRSELANLHEQLVTALKKRRALFDVELERQLDDDQLCDQFGNVANPLLKQIAASMSGLIRPKVKSLLLSRLIVIGKP